jgi:hypothetical protein
MSQANTDAAIRRLMQTFGQLDREVLESVLAVCDGNVQEAINFLQAQQGGYAFNPQANPDGIPADYPPVNQGAYQGWQQDPKEEDRSAQEEMRFKSLFLKESSLEQHHAAQRESYPEYTAVLLLLLNQGVELAKAARTRLLAALWARRDYELADYLLNKHEEQFGLPQVLAALQLLDAGRKVREVEKRIHRLQAQGTVKGRRLGQLKASINDLTREAHIGSVSGALIKRVKRWVQSIDEEKLSFYALTLPKEPWRELADILHLNPSKDFKCDWFLKVVFEEEPSEDSIVARCRSLNVNNVVELATKFSIPYSYLRLHVKPLPDDAKEAVARYEKIETLIWWHHELACPAVNRIIETRLKAGEQPKFGYGKLMERLLYFKGIDCPFYPLLLPAAEAMLSTLDLPMEAPVVVLGDASYSMDVAIRCSTIIGSVLAILADAELKFFSDKVTTPKTIPRTAEQVLEVATDNKADGLTAPACAILDYYKRREPVKFFIVVTDEIENVKSEDYYFPSIFQKYYREVAPARLVFVSFLQNPNEKGRMVRALEAMGIVPIQFRLDANRPDLTKLDTLLGLLSSEGNNFGTQMRVLAATLREKGVQAVVNHLLRPKRTLRTSAPAPVEPGSLKKEEAPAPAEKPVPGQDENCCVICEDRPITHCLLECGHLSFCNHCAPPLVGKECPLCRKVVTRTVRIYQS